MPELPEVEVVRQGLAAAVAGATVRSVDVLDERALKRHDGTPLDFVTRLEGRTFRPASRRGKFLWVPLEPLPAVEPLPSVEPVETPSVETPSVETRPHDALLTHLGMSGQMLVRTLGAPEDKQLRIRMRVDGPAGEFELRFIDQRLFGSLAIDDLVAPIDAAEERIPGQVTHIARDPIDPRFDRKLFSLRIRSTKRSIKAAILDQAIISGVGNIYADEALWRARLHWAQLANTVSARKVNELLEHVQDVFAQSLEEGGTSFDSLYVNVNGESGYFSRSLKAYGREGKPCYRCGIPIKREAFANRSSYRCPKCQRMR
ncbi:bifunctional DNA-formamidopyrimidine glycosylase/DNA-(apurinic or apyrimidinic site) lyase [Gulosibacter molinativorax]|uniref:Formamidopyrimidine-DNA glycosylase n=1 Tax=Gulosibacter molinativorax TaxID=256821 RepID=A0ABT7C8G9_9MICO|nr:bifunctional DNA-formamidopyrimidine glycosylase/DNA-(apurinic or apyrimidinic site) lyase [Gulosibacter molinativorax]MDJ1371498.1 bifunctional DNA-formamidopyrimidine glycosylase/DNA-(apurinic or apyrimidinic site) lyase [Gulosibacter molinativorax]QUY62440.1 Formamidopyrimidine-DNA glycosylase [Gulosibacter molinativorax]